MIIVEDFGIRSDGVKLVRRYSDRNVMLLQNETGAMYEDPVDIEDAPYTYSETDVSVASDSEIE